MNTCAMEITATNAMIRKATGKTCPCQIVRRHHKCHSVYVITRGAEAETPLTEMKLHYVLDCNL